MPALSLVYAYYLNPGMLAEQFKCWAAYPPEMKKQIEVVIVDAGGDDASAATVVRPSGLPPLRIYRLVKHEPWNQDAARNRGAHEATGKWLLLTDMDHLVPLGTLLAALAQKNKRLIYSFARVDAPTGAPKVKDGKPHPHPNSFLMTRDLYWQIGGYDERLVGIYGTDGIYRARAMQHATIHNLASPLIRYGRDVIADASTTTLKRRSPENDARKRKAMALRMAGRTVLTRPFERVL